MIDSLVEADRAVDSIRSVRRASAHAGRRRDSHGPHGKFRRTPGLHAIRADRAGAGLLGLQSSAEPDRPPGRPGAGGRLPRGGQAGQGDAAFLLPPRADPARSGPARRVVPTAGHRRSGRGQPDRRRSAGGLLHVHRQRRGRLAAAAAVGPGRPLLAGTWRRGAGDRGGRRRSRLRRAAAGERRLLSCRAGLRFRAADLRRPADRPDAGRADRRVGRAA